MSNQEEELMPDLQNERIHSLSMEPKTNKREIYNIWASTYEEYVKEQKYFGPKVIAKKLQEIILNINSIHKIEVLDFGCGTGLVGQEIQKLAINCEVDGLDISHQMLVLAGEKNCYRQLYNVNLMEEKLEKKYNLIVSCGVFLEGHAPISMIGKLIDNLDIEGVLMFTIRDSYLESEEEEVKKYILENERVKVLSQESIDYLEGVKCQLFLLFHLLEKNSVKKLE